MIEYKINNKIYKLNVFENISCSTDAYLIGYLLGDGGYHKETHKRKARLFISSTEKYIIEYFQKCYCPDSTILSKIPINKKRNIVSKIESHVLVFSSKFSETFKKYGLLSLKKERTYHNISKNYYSNFLLGLFDADGHFSWGKRKDRDRFWLTVGITHQNLNMLKKIQLFLLSNLNINSFIAPKKGEDCYILRLSNIEHCTIFLKYIYSGENLIYNKRKHNNYIDWLKAKSL
jgi:hypothetical protein